MYANLFNEVQDVSFKWLSGLSAHGQVLELLKVAWMRRLIFTVGTSSTTGEHDTVVWNGIHHKTEMMSNLSGHGYPDPNYLDNVLSELASQGVTEDCLKPPGSGGGGGSS